MGNIKSAWEIALEKTESIEVDKEKLQHRNAVESIRKAAGAYLAADTADAEKLKVDLAGYSPAELREGLMMTVLANISLPASNNAETERLERVRTLLSAASGNSEEAMALMDELVQFIGQYPAHRKDLMDKMKEQYRPILEEKSEKLSKQYGTAVHLSFENDKEFLEAANKNLERLEAQYQATLQNAKAQLKAIVEG